ncbi:CPBP family intramembrane glutamic endopeptidase [Staphylococcus carnosus]|uniref:Lysostaphin resistance protein A n=1 Tax=Staphylococcus carnosus TaxID=1281 RepID=A0AAJ0JQB6_STACA|nr:CPBP family intramembrane glutamic endopeptidase [Staphylococcus carnosus]KKB25357.1 lysostaphin resistance protein A [Staphylococcus carnosus]PNZ99410.1 CPBP family intramembrane metalloprotease [Staphylococcus carnosus]QQS84558.1 CPBP family intramembrane metalloprotease [Staphylococcus carnosus]QRQ04498.1 CPBP family intramembrane metalloprotease [Staphylococcus carnosus]UTB83506.1 lysostaphin resistance protein A [Staphylococcus carnosus]
MNMKRISGFQWAMTIFVFFVLAFAFPLILKDFQAEVPFKRFVFDMSTLAPFIAAIICIIVFKNKRAQIASLKLSLSFKVIERLLLALILPLIIFIICMFIFNNYADSFILLQSKNLSVSVWTILIGHLFMAFFVEFGFRSYLQNIVETKMNTFFASIIVGVLYAIWNVNTTYSTEFTLYNLLYNFSFSMIIGELIRATKGRTIYIAVVFHAAMTFALVFFFSEEVGDLFSMKVIALSTAAVAVVYIILSLIIRACLYYFTKDSLEEVDPDNYLEYPKDPEDDDIKTSPAAKAQTEEKEVHEKTSAEKESTETSEEAEERPTSSAVKDVKDEIKQSEENTEENTETNKRSPFSNNNHRR